jgi:hypothetical protein
MNSTAFSFESMTRIRLLGLTILEPVTVLTNLLIAAVCFYAYYQLRRQQGKEKVRQMVRFFFLAMGVATVTGGILGHGLLYLTGLYGKLPGWYASMIAVAFFERAVIEHARPLMSPNTGKFFSLFNYAEIAIFMGLAFLTLKFRFVEMHAAYGLFVVVFCFELYTYVKQKDPGSRYIFAGTLLAGLAAMTHAYEIGLNQWFNYNDVSHLLMAGAVYCYYLGAVNFKYYNAEDRSSQLVLSRSVDRLESI